MGVKEDKLGLDITGYMFIGEGNTEGLYFRIGVQTPFDTILGYLNLFNDDISKNENESSSPVFNNKISLFDPMIKKPPFKKYVYDYLFSYTDHFWSVTLL